jgi:hypothetical protein
MEVNLSFVLTNLIERPSLVTNLISNVVLGTSLNLTSKTGEAGFGNTLAKLLIVALAGLLMAVTTKLKLSLSVLHPVALVMATLYNPMAVGL